MPKKLNISNDFEFEIPLQLMRVTDFDFKQQKMIVLYFKNYISFITIYT